MRFLEYGDEPRYSCPLRAWPERSRVGVQIRVGAASDGRGRAFPIERIRHELMALTKDDEELIELIGIILNVLED